MGHIAALNRGQEMGCRCRNKKMYSLATDPRFAPVCGTTNPRWKDHELSRLRTRVATIPVLNGSVVAAALTEAKQLALRRSGRITATRNVSPNFLGDR